MSKLGIILIIIAVVIVGYFILQSNNQVEEVTDDLAGEVSGLIVGDNAIYAPDQKSGLSIKIGLAVLGEDGYVVIHEDNNGAPGKIIGSGELLSKGESRNVEANLSRVSVNGENLFAMLHKDNGDGKFNSAEDAPITDEQGNIILMKFLISDSAQEPGAVSL